jgi:hypothetical protein
MNPKEKPILFKADMVRAILRGQKTQTRRFHDNAKYAVGDTLWVRETWRPTHWGQDFEFMGIEYAATQGQPNSILFTEDLWPDDFRRESVWEQLSIECEKAGMKTDANGNFCWSDQNPLKWRPSIFMPKAACRLFLQVNAVRQEKLQDISPADAICEGVEPISAVIPGIDRRWWKNYFDESSRYSFSDPRASFASLWDSINKQRGLAWEENPAVYVYSFSSIDSLTEVSA